MDDLLFHEGRLGVWVSEVVNGCRDYYQITKQIARPPSTNSAWIVRFNPLATSLIGFFSSYDEAVEACREHHKGNNNATKD
jgi:hypothetical protein